MALTPRSGSLMQTSSLTEPNDRLGEFANVPVVRDANVERTAFNTGDYPQESKQILGYLDGSRITVPYYWKIPDITAYRGGAVDSTTSRHTIHDPTILIRQFELTVSSDFSYSFASDTTESSYTGQATTYPGFQPYVGDEFLIDSKSGRIFIMRVTEVEALSIHHERAHMITFISQGVLTPEKEAVLSASVASTRTFDKTLYFAGNKVLLTDTTFEQYTTLTRMKAVILKHYFKTFFHAGLRTIISPDGVYDPYLTHFIQAISPFEVVKCRPNQLLSDSNVDYEMTIWARLTDLNAREVDDIVHWYSVVLKQNRFTDVSITSLINRPYVLLRPDVDPTVPQTDPTLSSLYAGIPIDFYKGLPANLDEFHAMLYEVVTKRTISDIQGFIDRHVMSYRSDEKAIQFYKSPLIMAMIDCVVKTFARSHKT